MKPRTIILIGNVGAGKTTQAKLLEPLLARAAKKRPLYVLKNFSKAVHAYIDGKSFGERKLRTLFNRGERLPTFMASTIWIPDVFKRLEENADMLIDGVPRHLYEAHAFDSLLTFFERPQPVEVIHILVPKKEANARLLARKKTEGRADDTPEAITRRLAWFVKETLPVIRFFEKSRRYRVIEIDGSGSPRDVHEEIRKKLKL